MSGSERVTTSDSDTSFAPRRSRRQPTCDKEHFLRGTPAMSADDNDAPSSPTPSSVSTVTNPEMVSLLQMLTAQNSRLESLRLQQETEQRAKDIRLEEQRMRHEERQEEQRRQHELAMAKFQATLLQAQTTSVKALAEEAEIARRRGLEEAERLRTQEATIRLEQMQAMEERQAAALTRKAEDDRRAKVEAAIRHVKRDTPKF